jgi:hypothetical protein
MSSSTLGTRFGRRHRMTRAIIEIALTVLVAALAQLTGATALKGSANTQDDRYIAALAQRSGGIVKTCGLGCFRRPPFRLIRSVRAG